MQDIFRAIGRLSQSDLTVLISGESGTGKELVAESLHQHSPRRDGPFIAINTGAIPGELLESELFGHEKGAFTGALAQHKGRFEQADGGTLFLDEIGDMPAESQTRLLRALSEGRFFRVGGRKEIKVIWRNVSQKVFFVKTCSTGSMLSVYVYLHCTSDTKIFLSCYLFSLNVRQKS
jgi:two-component system nitrogen regulation response regulator GlnG